MPVGELRTALLQHLAPSRSQLARLRGVGRDNGPEELRSKLQNFNRDEVRELALEAGLRVRKDR